MKSDFGAMRCQRYFLWTWAALLIAPSSASKVIANPMEKVIELLDVLGKQIKKEGAEDEAAYNAYVQFHQGQASKGGKIIKENANKIAQAQSDLKEAEAFRQGKNKDLVDLANKNAKNAAELDGGRSGRAKDRTLFEKNEAVFIESLDQLERALVVMAKKAPAAAAAASSASLLSVAQRLKSTLTGGGDFAMSTAQRETLDSFMRQAQAASEKEHPEEAAPSFLQIARGPYGEYQGKSGGLVTTLQDLEGKVKTERETALTAEKKAKDDFKTFESGLTEMLENQKKSLADIKASIAQSQEQSSQKTASLMEAQEIYKAEVKHMEQIEAEFRGKTQAYKIRLGKRSDEAIATHEAQRILSSEIAKSYIKQQSVGSVSSFIQMSQDTTNTRRKVLDIIKQSNSPVLSFLAMKSFRHAHGHGHGHRADPFAKVKSMLVGMLKKLKEKQAAESRHAEWCDREMGKTAKAQKRKGEDVQKIKDRLDALDADLTQIKADIVTLGKDLKDIQEANVGALKIREQESKQAKSSLKQYKDAAALLERACKVLKNYYQNKAGGGKEVDKKEFKQRNGLGTGIIGILEIAIDDFKKLHAETKEAEDASAKDFKETQNESAIRMAVFQKDLDWKSRTKVKMEFDQSTMNNDLTTYTKEKTAIDSYFEKLKGSCTVKGPTYAEKKAQRESELKSLKEAMEFLTSQGVGR